MQIDQLPFGATNGATRILHNQDQIGISEVQEENGLTAWLLHILSGTPLHLRNLDLILRGAEPVTKVKPKLPKSSLVYVTCDSDKSSVDEASWWNALGINGWWE